MGNRIVLGWREWVHLPDLGLPWIKAKVDTGAKTSCLHAFSLDTFVKDGDNWVRFGIHPHQNETDTEIYCEAKIIEQRIVSDSGGHKENRIVISSDIVLGEKRWPIEITLTNRDTMQFRMLLGRTAMQNLVTVKPDKSYLLRKPESE